MSGRAPVPIGRTLLWALPLALIAVSGTWMVVHASGFRGMSASLERSLERERSDRAQLGARRSELEALWVRALETGDRTERLYVEGFSTERNRLTDTIRLVKDLASRAGLEPRAISYPEERIEEFGLVRRSFVFNVDGTYADLRTFLHLLELSPAFVTLNQISVSEASDGLGLKLALRLSTVFEETASDDADARGGPPGERLGGGT